MIVPKIIHESWTSFLTPEIRKELEKIEVKIGNDYTPNEDKVLRFLSLDLNNAKVVILGQDPYKPLGVANGRSFQPDNLYSWTQPFKQVSLKNIIRLIYRTENNIELYSDIPSYKEILKEIATGNFAIKEPKEWFDFLEKQGVLFLNTYLTCKIGVSNSHKKIWESFSHHMLEYISETNPELNWFLWGSEAILNKCYIKQGKIYQSRHPMMCSDDYENDFLKCECFKETKELISWLR